MTGSLTVGSIVGVDWTGISSIPAGFADGIDNTGGSDIWTINGSNISYTSGNVGIGTSSPAGKLDVSGDICLGGVCRTTWPAGSGSGAFTDTGSVAYYSGGNVGIGTATPQSLTGVDSKILHMVHTAAPSGSSAAGLRLEISGLVEGGIVSSYNAGVADGGLFVGTLSNHQLTLGTNSGEHLTITRAGNVGIGTQGALQPLHVQGNAYVYDKLGIGVEAPTNDLQISGSNALFSAETGDFRTFISKKLETDIASLIFENNFSSRAQLGLVNDDDFHIQVSADGATFKDAIFIDSTNAHIGVGTVTNTDYYLFTVERQGNAFQAVSYENGIALGAVKDVNDSAVVINKIDTGTGNSLAIIHKGSDPALVIRNSTSDLMVVESGGNVGIGTATPMGTLDVNGSIYQRGSVLHADYVFEPDYQLESIEEHAEFMWNSKHLKSIPKAEVDMSGREIVEVGSHRRGIVEELEKAHIYIEQLNKQINDQQIKMQLLEDRLLKMENADKS